MNSFESAVINVEFFWEISTFNINNFTTEIKKSNTFVGFCYIKMKPKGGKKRRKKGDLENSQPKRKLHRFHSVVKICHWFFFLRAHKKAFVWNVYRSY